MAGTTPAAVVPVPAAASLPAVPSTSSAGVPPPAPRAYAQVAAAPPPAATPPPAASTTISSGRGPFPTLTRKHGVRCLLVPASPHVETYVRALARVVGPTAIVAASKMYGKVVFFLASEAAAQEAVETGLAVGGVFVPLEPLEDLGVRLVLTSVPPFLPNAALLPALSALGHPISVISPLPLGCKDPALRHVLSFRRQVQLQLPPAARDGEALEGSFVVPYQGARYRVHYSTGEARCYLCRAMGHVRRDCPLARHGGASGTPEPRYGAGPVTASAPSCPAPEAAPPPSQSTAVEEGAAAITPSVGEGPPQGDSSLVPVAPPLPPRVPKPLPLPPDLTPVSQPLDDAMEGWSLVQGKRGKRKAPVPLHLSDSEAPRKSRKGVSDDEPSALPPDDARFVVPAGRDVAAPDGDAAPPPGSLPEEALEGAPLARLPSAASARTEVGVASGVGGEGPGVADGNLPSIYEEIEALGLTPVTQGEDDPLLAGLDLSDLTSVPLSPVSPPLTAASAPASEGPLGSSIIPAAGGTPLTAAEPVEATADAPLPGPDSQGVSLLGVGQPTPCPTLVPSTSRDAIAAPRDTPQGAALVVFPCSDPSGAAALLPPPPVELGSGAGRVASAHRMPRRGSAPCLPALVGHGAVTGAPLGDGHRSVTPPPHALREELRAFLEDVRGSRNKVQLALQRWGDFHLILRAAKALIGEGKGTGKQAAATYRRVCLFRDSLLTHGFGHGLLRGPTEAVGVSASEDPPQHSSWRRSSLPL